VLYFGTGDPQYTGVAQRYADKLGLRFAWVGRDAKPWRAGGRSEGVTDMLRRAAFVLIWNGLQDKAPLAARYCRRRGVPHAFMEWGMLPQNETFMVDPRGFCGDSVLCGDLGWVTDQDMQLLGHVREQLREDHPISDNGDVLVPMQIFDDTQVLYHTPYDTMQEFVEHLIEIFGRDKLLIRPHPKGGADYSELGVRVDNPKTPFLESACRARCVVGLTSTCLLEAAVLGKPVLALGDGALRVHPASLHDRVAAGALALTFRRKSGDLSSVLDRFGIRPLVVDS
jgi:hypothetical protein